MSKKILVRKSELLIFLLLLPLYRPTYLATESYTFLDAFFVYGKLFSFFVALILYISGKINSSKMRFNKKRAYSIAIYLLFFVCMLVSGLINHNMAEVGSAFLPVITTIILYIRYVDDDVTKFLNPLSILLYLYVFINLITVVLYPNGMYSANVNEMSSRIETGWFLGYRNPQVRILLPAVSLAFICDIIKYNRVRIKSYLLLLAALLTVVMIKSSTALVGFAVFLIIYFIRWKWNVKVKPIWFLAFNGVFFLGIVVLRLQNLLSFLIVNLLHKDLSFTGRTIIWDQAILLIIQHPLFANGATQFPIGNYFVATHPHNFMLYLLVKSGIVGFLFFTVSAIICAKQLEKYQESKVIQVLIMEFCAFFTMTVTESITEAIFFWIIIIMGICAKNLSDYEENKYDRDRNTIKSK